MPAGKVEAGSPKIGIEPPGLELDLGYSILEARPSVKFKLSFGPLTRKADRDRFKIPLREWWVRFRGARDGKRELVDPSAEISTSFEEKILRERHVKVSELSSAAETEFGVARKDIEALTPPDFDASTTIERLRNQSLMWVRQYKEALQQATQNERRAAREHKQADSALNQFVEQNALAAKRPPARKSPWDRAASLAAMVVIEALISLPPIADRKGGGQLVLSFLYPLSVSIANAVIGVLVGLIGVYTLKYSRTIAAKVLAGVGVTFAFIVVGWMNLAVARWREGNETPLSLTSLLPSTALSIVLLVIGLGVFAFAVYKGVRDFSPGFPGHEEKWDEHYRASRDFHYWKDRCLLLIHTMRRTSTEKLDHVRQQLAVVKSIHGARETIAKQMLADLQTEEKILPELLERVDSSARALLKAYRESAHVARRAVAGSQTPPSLVHPTLPASAVRSDIQQIKGQIENLRQVVERNLGALTECEQRLEKEVAAEIDKHIDAVSEEARRHLPAGDV